jgi:hypothetical protein
VQECPPCTTTPSTTTTTGMGTYAVNLPSKLFLFNEGGVLKKKKTKQEEEEKIETNKN